jgi:23S rRNA (pseudouridine1915-N3)-methyltransferase
MKEVVLLVVGKLKSSEHKKIENDFLQRITDINFKVCEVPPRPENLQKETQEITKKISSLTKNENYKLITLDEKGKSFTSIDFANWLNNLIENSPGKIIFLIGGSDGLHTDLKKQASESLCLSKMTFPHKLARIFFIEQVYRAQTILCSHPYHK